MSWVVPAKVDGTWQLDEQPLTLSQQYQMVTGTLGTTPISAGKLKGDELTFTAAGKVYTGRVDGTRIAGQGWTATKSK